MATVAGGLFDPNTNLLDPATGGIISSFLDQLGISETSITQVTINPTGTTIIEDTTPLVNVSLSGTTGQTVVITGSGSGQVVNLQTSAGTTNTFNYTPGNDTVQGGSGDDVLVSGAGNDNFNIGDSAIQGLVSDSAFAEATAQGTKKKVVVDTGSGNDTITSGSTYDSIFGGSGNDSISSGDGSDTISGGIGNDTINAGSGFDVVSMTGTASSYEFAVVNGKVMSTSKFTGDTTSIQNAEYVQFADGSAIVNSSNQEDASLARMTLGFYGEQVSAERLMDLNDDVNSTNLKTVAGQLLSEQNLLSSSAINDADFVELMYTRVLGRASDDAGKAFYEAALADGSKSRADILADFGWSNEGVDHFDGSVNTIDGWV